jgi:hypothetical protein
MQILHKEHEKTWSLIIKDSHFSFFFNEFLQNLYVDEMEKMGERKAQWKFHIVTLFMYGTKH